MNSLAVSAYPCREQGNVQSSCTNSIVGSSVAFQSILQTIEMVASRTSSVIITGETGTGKEMVAKHIHQCSNRANNRFIPVDCTALNGNILESQLFGHTKGAFTGAVSDTLGFFRAADGGTIFLDEIGELDLDLQAKLLRVLQESSVTPVGSTQSYPTNVRVLCATNRNLKEMISQGKFRPDLYFRLNIVTLEVPPLRQRRDDILLLANHFLKMQANLYQEQQKILSPEAEEILINYSWPGNVRELANAIEHSHITSASEVIEPNDLPSDILTEELANAMNQPDSLSLKILQKQFIIKALKKTNGKKMAAAKLLEIDHRKLDRLVDEFQIAHNW